MAIRDVHFGLGMALFVGVAGVAYLGRVLVRGRARHARTDLDGGSVFLNKSTMEIGYWLLDPVVSGLVALRLTPDQVTLFALVPALLAGVALAFGWFGLGCVLGTLSAFCDVLDGLLARRTGVASDAGEVIDTAVDRYAEFFFLAGVGIYYRTHWMVLLVTMAALFGSFMVTYTTAKAEAMGVTTPRAPMRRAERAVYLFVAAGLTSLSRVLFAGTPSHALRELPMLFVLLLVAAVTNVSAVQRFAFMAGALRGRRSGGPVAGPETESPPVGDPL